MCPGSEAGSCLAGAQRPASGVHSLYLPLSLWVREHVHAPCAPSFCLPTGPAPVTAGCHPKALLGLLQKFPMHCSLPSLLSKLSWQGAKHPPGGWGQSQVLRAPRGPHQLLSLGPRLGDEPSRRSSSAERSLGDICVAYLGLVEHGPVFCPRSSWNWVPMSWNLAFRPEFEKPLFPGSHRDGAMPSIWLNEWKGSPRTCHPVPTHSPCSEELMNRVTAHTGHTASSSSSSEAIPGPQ